MRLRALVAAIALSATGAACSTTISGHGTAALSRTTPGGLPAGWRLTVDAPTGIRFGLPGKPTLQRQQAVADDGTPYEQRVYQVQNSAGAAVSVNVDSGVGFSVHPSALSAIPERLLIQFKSVGAGDAAILERRNLTVDAHPALSFRLRFTPLDHSKGPSVWFVCAIDAGDALVLAQTIAFPAPGQEAGLLAKERPIQNELVAGITLS